MNKILGYIAVFLVFSWVTTANATVATIKNSNGVLTVDGFIGATDADKRSMNFTFNFADTNLNGTPFSNGDSGIVQIFQAINSGQIYTVNANFTITDLGTTFNSNFDIKSTVDVATYGPASLDDALGPNVGYNNPATGTISVDLTGFPVTLNLTNIAVVGTAANPSLILSTFETDTNRNLSRYLTCLDTGVGGCTRPAGLAAPNNDGKVVSGFTNANLTVPEPATLLLLGSGLLGMFGFSRKRA